MTRSALPTGAASSANQATDQTLTGAVLETAPVTDTASSGLNGRLQRIAQRLTSLIALLPASLGQKTMANGLAVTIASDQSVVPVSDNAGSLTVDAPVGTPVFVRLSDGSTAIATLPVSIAATVVVDTELPAAAALADATANPTTPVVGALNLLFNGTTWDRARGDTANGVDVDVTRLPAIPTGANVIGALTANQSVNQAQIAGTATDTNSGNKSAGTQRVVLATDQPNLTTPLNANVAQINGVAPLMGAGVTGTGSERVTPSTSGTGSAVTGFTAATNTTLLSSNAAARLRTIYNNSDQDLYILLGTAAVSTTSFHVRIAALGGFFQTSDYSGQIQGIMAAAIGSGQVNIAETT